MYLVSPILTFSKLVLNIRKEKQTNIYNVNAKIYKP